MATTFGWKKKIPHDLSRKRPSAFTDNEEQDDATSEKPTEQSLLPMVKRLHSAGDNKTASKRLREEGAALAQKERLAGNLYFLFFIIIIIIVFF